MEEFRDVIGYEGIYQISNMGRVKSLARESFTGRRLNEKILKPYLENAGYFKVVLTKDGKKKTRTIHQLVAEAFLDHTPCGYKLIVNHKNFIRHDNRAENLEIDTQRNNTNKKHIKSSSEYVGVTWSKQGRKWRANIRIKNKIKHLGLFTNEQDAGNAYEAALLNWETKGIEPEPTKFSSEFKGVSWSKQKGKWRSYININGKSKYLGLFACELKAAYAYQTELKRIK